MTFSLLPCWRGLLAAGAVVMLPLVIAAGCDAPEECEGAACNPSSCPASYPDSQACSAEGESCTYASDACALKYTCLNGVFELAASDCIIPCDDLPSWYDFGETYLDGACAKIEDGCTVTGTCSQATWTCGADHAWRLVHQEEEACCVGAC